MSSAFSLSVLLNKAREKQDIIESRGRRFIQKTGPGFIVGLFSFSLIACGTVGVIYYHFFDKGIKYLITGGKYDAVPIYANPLFIILFGFMILIFLLMEKISEQKKTQIETKKK